MTRHRSPLRNAALHYTERWLVITALLLADGQVFGWVPGLVLSGLVMAWTLPRQQKTARPTR